MVAKPDVIVAEICHELAPSALNSCVVRCTLAAAVAFKADPLDALVIHRRDDGLGIIGAAIADDDDLEVGMCLVEHTGKGHAEYITSVVCGDHDADKGLVGARNANMCVATELQTDACLRCPQAVCEREPYQRKGTTRAASSDSYGRSTASGCAWS